VTTYRLKGVPLIPFIVTALLLPPFVEEIAIGQNTPWVALPVALGCYLVALRGWSWTAGLLLSWAICKPHDFFLPLVVVGMELARRRDWRTCLGGALGLRTFTERYMLAFLVWPFFSPYGFLSDQVVLILPVAFFVQRILSMSDNVRALQFLTALTLLVGLTYLMDIVVLVQTRLSWFFFAPSVLVLVRSFGRSVTEVAAE